MEPTQGDSDLGPPQAELTTFSRIRRCISLTSSLDGATSLPLQVEEERPKTRRVNPQRLALRLGPELVAEMEALIVPGAKMPTFAIRKDFQERYCVDRRHIYDYFHSRGLRVAKEDKHTNLKRVRSGKMERLPQPSSPTRRLLAQDSLQANPEHISQPQSNIYSNIPLPHAPRRSATYPGSLYPKQSEKVALRDLSPEPSLPPTSPQMPASPSLESSPETIASSMEAFDLYWQSDGRDQFSGQDSPSTSESLRESKDKDFMDPLGSAWALDQCNSLYDLLDGEYPQLRSSNSSLAEPYQAQGFHWHDHSLGQYFMTFVGDGTAEALAGCETSENHDLVNTIS